ncbi:MAG: ATP-dependent RNA helicase HrpA, partial [Thermodesulfobacteriota bacterium]|nr:ATP-dependent RNA helicase HrpA [Thermodesulfobacteriota bacterium]
MGPDTAKATPDTAKAAINQRIRQARSHLSTVYGADRHTLERKFSQIRRMKPGPGYQAAVEDRLKYLEQAIKASTRRRTWRRHHRPATIYPETDLPILAKKDEIIDAIEKHRVMIISGETGSGKTTQIPKFCMDAGRGLDGIIGCTQPRRIAATTVARRIAEELGQPLGKAVGYKIRFRDKTSPDGFIKIMTDGILLAEIQADPFLNGYDTVIVDEAHERSLNIDLTLGIIKRLLSRRRNLKLIVTSATIDTQKFSRAFNDAPIIEVSGQMYPVQIRYQAPASTADSMDSSPVDLAVEAVERLGRVSPRGDILVFMPTEEDIRDTCRLLEGRCDQHTTVFPLFARLAGPEQSRVFARVSGRKIIVATNVAETSITIPGIKYVVDTGLARIPRYTPRSRCTLLPIDPISRSSADQRKGRCGRVADGVCVRLYSEEDYLSRPLFTPPEILRANLADVILRMIALKLGDVADFPFIDPPPAKSIQDGFNLLLELGAITPIHKNEKGRLRYRLTADGKMMARLPIDPRLSRMLIEARRCGCLAEIAIIAAVLSVQDPRERPLEMQKEADRVHAAWVDPESDFVTLLNIWRWYDKELSAGKGVRKIKRFCRDHFLSYRRMREWKDIHHQLRIVLKESGIHVGTLPETGVLSAGEKMEFSPRYTAVHQSILSGFLSNIACKKEKNIYTAAKGREVMIFPGSGLFNQAGKWIVAAEMVLTSRLFARTVAHIDPGWLESLAGDRCRYTYTDPHWDRKKGTVVAAEQVSLFGLVIVPRRNVVYGRIDADQAGDIFIESALVEGDFQQPFSFVLHNQGLIDQVLDMENRLRRRDLFIGNDVLGAFYHQRLEGVWNVPLLKQKVKKAGGDGFLRMQKGDLFRFRPDKTALAGFPNTIQLGEGTYPCTYVYEPGGPADGVTVSIPAGTAAAVPLSALDWLVPGLIGEKIKALVRGLPKMY